MCWRGSARRRGRRRRRPAAPRPGSRTARAPRRRAATSTVPATTSCSSIGARPVEPTGGDGVDEVAALDAAADGVVAHDGGAALDDVGADLAAVVLRRSDGADQRSVGDRRRREQRCRARRDGDDHVGAVDRGRRRRRRDGGDARALGRGRRAIAAADAGRGRGCGARGGAAARAASICRWVQPWRPAPIDRRDRWCSAAAKCADRRARTPPACAGG